MTRRALAEQLGVENETVGTLRQAVPLHDIGKIALEDSLLPGVSLNHNLVPLDLVSSAAAARAPSAAPAD